MKQKKLKVLHKRIFKSHLVGILLCVPFITQAISVDTPEELRNEYTLISEQMCHSSLEYPLDIIFEGNKEASIGAKEQYNKRMECLFESAFVKATNEMNKDFNNKFFEKIYNKNGVSSSILDWSPVDRSMTNGTCADKDDLEKVFQKQKDNGYKTLCKVDSRKSVSETLYSACRVSEVAWNEYCAYQEYLKWKMKDESVYQEFQLNTGKNDNDSWNKYRDIEQSKYERELSVSFRILEETLQQYQTFEQDYRIHLWQKVIAKALAVTREQLKWASVAIKKWPAKFKNSTSK